MADAKRANRLPAWADKMREIFRGGTTSQFVVHGNVFDFVAHASDAGTRFVPLSRFLVEVLFEPFDVVLTYNRGKGIRAPKGEKTFFEFLSGFDRFNQTNYASAPLTMPKEPRRALEVIDRFLLYALHRLEVRDEKAVSVPIRVAVIVEHAEFVAPAGEAVQLASDLAENIIRLLDWASDPSIQGAQIATVLVTESLSDLNRSLVESPHVARVQIDLPNEADALEYIEALGRELPSLPGLLQVPLASMAKKAVGLTRVNLRNLVTLAVQNERPIDVAYLSRTKRELIEKECFGLLEFVETTLTLDAVSGLDEAKTWLREDAELLRRGELRALPMGYLLAGRIGTGKTFLTTCWAGEIGIPCVVFKNFRDKWQGSTEGNLEKIFTVLHALGQVLVFIDEADQATGRRGGGDGDSGVSGRVYGMLAAEMSNTQNRGRILWVFATSRPDLLEVDLKRAGRLDVHIPLFPPDDAAGRTNLFRAMARKAALTPEDGDLPELPADLEIGGNEMEAILIQARRRLLLRRDGDTRTLAELVGDGLRAFRPSAHTRALEYMDLVATKECTDNRFLPARYRDLTLDEIEHRIDALRPFVR